jgi:ABC-type sugar transport system ATPase subunit
MNLVPASMLGVNASGQLAGFRPEHVEVGNGSRASAHYDATVEVVEYLGDEQLAHLRFGETALVAKFPIEQRLEAGSTQTFSVPLQKVFLFDGESERSLGTAA